MDECVQEQEVKAHCAIVACRSIYCSQLIKQAKDKRQSQLQANLKESVLNAAASAATSSSKQQQQTNATKLPPFYLNTDEFLEIKLNCDNSDALRIVLEFLYTDRLLSLEGRGE
jgi:hypothetical protein